jgi:hypothetical protein
MVIGILIVTLTLLRWEMLLICVSPRTVRRGDPLTLLILAAKQGCVSSELHRPEAGIEQSSKKQELGLIMK